VASELLPTGAAVVGSVNGTFSLQYAEGGQWQQARRADVPVRDALGLSALAGWAVCRRG